MLMDGRGLASIAKILTGRIGLRITILLGVWRIVLLLSMMMVSVMMVSMMMCTVVMSMMLVAWIDKTLLGIRISVGSWRSSEQGRIGKRSRRWSESRRSERHWTFRKSKANLEEAQESSLNLSIVRGRDVMFEPSKVLERREFREHQLVRHASGG